MTRFYIAVAILLYCGFHPTFGIVRLTNNGYEGVVIAISDSVNENQFPDLPDQEDLQDSDPVTSSESDS